jgi:hypothetical protein
MSETIKNSSVYLSATGLGASILYLREPKVSPSSLYPSQSPLIATDRINLPPCARDDVESTNTLHKPRKTFDMICSPGLKVFAKLFMVVACGAASVEHLFERVGKLDRVLGAELFLV